MRDFWHSKFSFDISYFFAGGFLKDRHLLSLMPYNFRYKAAATTDLQSFTYASHVRVSHAQEGARFQIRYAIKLSVHCPFSILQDCSIRFILLSYRIQSYRGQLTGGFESTNTSGTGNKTDFNTRSVIQCKIVQQSC